MENKFEPIRVDLATEKVELNVVSKVEYSPDIEWNTITVEERGCCIFNTLNFSCNSDDLIREMIYASVFWIHSFPPEYGISSTMIPRPIPMDQHIDFN